VGAVTVELLLLLLLFELAVLLLLLFVLLVFVLAGESGGVVVMMGSELSLFGGIKRVPELERSKFLPLFRRLLPDRLNRGELLDRISVKASTPKQVIFHLLSCVTR
jgi:hypothetical protein